MSDDFLTPRAHGLPVALVTCDPQLTPGQLTREAWEIIERADLVGASPAVQAHADALAAQGVPIAPDALETLRLRRFAGDLAFLCTPAEARAHSGGDMVIVGAEAGPGTGVLELVEVMDRLRSPGGCPWDAEQTHESLAPYAIEEAYELADAIASGDRDELADELGDVLLQVVFHARVAAEAPTDPFDIDDVAARIVAKLRRRHPHVFADVHAPSAAHVQANWDAIKAAEKPERTGVLDGIPSGLPPLERTAKVASRLVRAGREAEVRAAAERLAAAADPGSQLLATALTCALDGHDPAAALRATLRELEAGFAQGASE
ncbi:XTP/dITP diphosphohydrolase [Kineosphaera limosa]|uniref:MazG family protein n=1 Tax=Kineosphaera limosa NBRC 100340 TaxID=1184609 RepID=K6WPK4_9MICO|nr:MazG family protein [Kineosphaera limosa]NYE02208.1 XTP/dITP diphosphohydrolase [Kineosphaera limosa]GAB94062.1 MazG family protein [Kineosphaera limosa NBRC 100340]